MPWFIRIGRMIFPVGLKVNTVMVASENAIGASGNLPGGKGLGIKLVQERIDIFNRTYRQKAVFTAGVQPMHCTMGYRCELSFPV